MSRNDVKVPVIGGLFAVAIMAMLIAPAYADPIVKPTSAGTLNISFETNPATPNPGDQTELKISFLNKQNTVQQHIDYRVSMTQGVNQVFGTPVTHTAEGSVSIPFQFQTAGTYQVTVEVQGILFQPIPPETASFTINVGGDSASVPEFGPVAGMIIAVSTIGVIILSKKTQLRI
jgi:predicted secreted protein with PEFG-CTERM motif